MIRAVIAASLLAAALVAALPGDPVPGEAPLRVAEGGAALISIVVSADASEAERRAGDELGHYLSRATGTALVPLVEGRERSTRRAIHVGPTAFVRAQGIDCASAGPEGWILRNAGRHLVVCGGRPRGTLYAAYHLLEDEVGVRWWTPFDEFVPVRDRLELPRLDRTGRPAFEVRDLNGIPGSRAFCARNRLNGHFALLDEAHGGFEGYGPPKQVHNFFIYVPPERFFERHPDYFSEVGGMRYAEGSQLCLTHEDLPGLVGDRMVGLIEQSRRDAARRGGRAPRLFDFSQNDQGRACACPDCVAVYEREGSRSGTVIEFVNRLADRVAERYPEVLVDTLAYGFSFDPPERLRARDNVVVRLAPLYGRDFSKPLSHPSNQFVLAALRGWSERVKHLRVWDYAVTFGDDGDLPLPNLPFIGEALRAYLTHGVEGVFVQQDPAVGTDLNDLKLWITIKLLEDPQADFERLLREFTDGYYGAAGPYIREYVERLSLAARERPSRILFGSPAEDFNYLDGPFIVEAQRLFDGAESAVAKDPELIRRVRHARLTLDRATLHRWELLSSADGSRGITLDPAAVAERYRRTWVGEIRRRYPEREREEAIAEANERVDDLIRRRAGS